MFKIILLIHLFEKLFSYDGSSFEIYKEQIKICNNCIPYNLKFSTNGTISVSIPCLYDINGSKIDNDIDATFAIIDPKPKDISSFSKEYKLYSVMGYTIDIEDNYYILDQGKIFADNNTVEKNTSKLLIINAKGEKKEEFYFEDIGLTKSLLTDIVVDHEGKFAYIVDSGNLNNDNNIPGIIVFNIKDKKAYKILNNHDSFKKNSNKILTSSTFKNKLNDYFSSAVGVNSIQISCNDDTIYYSSLYSINIYSVSTKNISKAIEKFESSNDKNVLNDIEVNSVNRNFFSQKLLISSKNNIFMINKESKNIEVSFNINGDLSFYDYSRNSKMKFKDNNINSPYSFDIYGRNLYILDNKIDNNGINNFSIYKAELKKDELNNYKGCTIFIFKLNGGVIFVFVWFFIVLCIAILLIIVNSGQYLEKSRLMKEKEEEEEINELNRKLND